MIDKLKASFENVLIDLGYNLDDPSLNKTPERMARMLVDLTSGQREDPEQVLEAVFQVTYDEMVILTGIPFWSLCEHHLLPFHGEVHIGYIPAGKVVGLSKLPRLVGVYSRRLQLQERMTADIANAIQSHLKPQGVGVVISGQHTCMQMRGVKSLGTMVTSCLLGAMRDKPAARAEFLKLAY